MLMMQQVEAAEREQHAAKKCRGKVELKTAQEPDGSAECGQIVGDQFDIERGPEGQDAIDQLVKRVERAGLTFAVYVVSREDRRRPQYAISRGERLLVEMPHRQMKPGQVVEHEDAAGEQRHKQRCEQRSAADANQEGERTIHRGGFRKARISSPRRM